MFNLFFQNYKGLQGSIVPNHNKDQVEKAITLHPFKDHKYMYGMKQYQLQSKIRKLKAKMMNITDYIEEMNKQIESHSQKQGHQSRDEILRWSFLKENKYFPYIEQIVPSRHFLNLYKKHLQLLKKWINDNTKQHPIVSSLKHLNYGYQTLNPKYVATTITNEQVQFSESNSSNRQYKIVQRFRELKLDGTEDTDIHKANEKVNFVIPLYGRPEPFLRFVKTFENVVFKNK